MQQGSGFVLVLIGLLALWVVISGKFDLLESFLYQLLDIPLPASETKYPGVTGSATATKAGAPIEQQELDDMLDAIGAPRMKPATPANSDYGTPWFTPVF